MMPLTLRCIGDGDYGPPVGWEQWAYALDRLVGSRGRRDGIVTTRVANDEHGPITEVGAYYIGPYESVLWVAGLFWGPAQASRPLSMKWGWSGEAQGHTRLVSARGITEMATEYMLQKQAEVRS